MASENIPVMLNDVQLTSQHGHFPPNMNSLRQPQVSASSYSFSLSQTQCPYDQDGTVNSAGSLPLARPLLRRQRFIPRSLAEAKAELLLMAVVSFTDRCVLNLQELMITPEVGI